MKASVLIKGIRRMVAGFLAAITVVSPGWADPELTGRTNPSAPQISVQAPPRPQAAIPGFRDPNAPLSAVLAPLSPLPAAAVLLARIETPQGTIELYQQKENNDNILLVYDKNAGEILYKENFGQYVVFTKEDIAGISPDKDYVVLATTDPAQIIPPLGLPPRIHLIPLTRGKAVQTALLFDPIRQSSSPVEKITFVNNNLIQVLQKDRGFWEVEIKDTYVIPSSKGFLSPTEDTLVDLFQTGENPINGQPIYSIEVTDFRTGKVLGSKVVNPFGGRVTVKGFSEDGKNFLVFNFRNLLTLSLEDLIPLPVRAVFLSDIQTPQGLRKVYQLPNEKGSILFIYNPETKEVLRYAFDGTMTSVFPEIFSAENIKAVSPSGDYLVLSSPEFNNSLGRPVRIYLIPLRKELKEIKLAFLDLPYPPSLSTVDTVKFLSDDSLEVTLKDRRRNKVEILEDGKGVKTTFKGWISLDQTRLVNFLPATQTDPNNGNFFPIPVIFLEVKDAKTGAVLGYQFLGSSGASFNIGPFNPNGDNLIVTGNKTLSVVSIKDFKSNAKRVNLPDNGLSLVSFLDSQKLQVITYTLKSGGGTVESHTSYVLDLKTLTLGPGQKGLLSEDGKVFASLFLVNGPFNGINFAMPEFFVALRNLAAGTTTYQRLSSAGLRAVRILAVGPADSGGQRIVAVADGGNLLIASPDIRKRGTVIGLTPSFPIQFFNAKVFRIVTKDGTQDYLLTAEGLVKGQVTPDQTKFLYLVSVSGGVKDSLAIYDLATGKISLRTFTPSSEITLRIVSQESAYAIVSNAAETYFVNLRVSVFARPLGIRGDSIREVRQLNTTAFEIVTGNSPNQSFNYVFSNSFERIELPFRLQLGQTAADLTKNLGDIEKLKILFELTGQQQAISSEDASLTLEQFRAKVLASEVYRKGNFGIKHWVDDKIQSLLGRKATAEEVKRWSDFLETSIPKTSVETARNHVLNGVRVTLEYVRLGGKTAEAIIGLYRDIFQGLPDPAKLKSWVAQFKAGVPLAAMAKAFRESAEFKALTQTKLNQELAIFYGRTPTENEKKRWADQLASGQLSWKNLKDALVKDSLLLDSLSKLIKKVFN